MALTASQRHTIYQNFAPILGEEVAEALLSQFPANDLETPATKDFVRAECIALKSDVVHEIAQFRADLADCRADLKAEIAGVRDELKADVADCRREIAGVRDELKADIAGLRVEMGDLRAELHRELRLHLVATLTFVGALLTAFRLL
jgi:hypothetical protein